MPNENSTVYLKLPDNEALPVARQLISTASTGDLMYEIGRRMLLSFKPLFKLSPSLLVTLLAFDSFGVALLSNRLVFDHDANFETEEVLAAAIDEAKTFDCDFELSLEACDCEVPSDVALCTPTANLAAQLAHFLVIDDAQSSRLSSSTLAIFSLALVLYLALKIKDRHANPQLPLIPTKEELKAACTPTKPTFSELCQQIKDGLAPLYETNSFLSAVVIALACFGMALLVNEWSAGILESRALNNNNSDLYNEVINFVATVFSCDFIVSTEACACEDEALTTSCTDAAALSGEVYATQSAIDETNKTLLTAFIATTVGAIALGGALTCAKRCQARSNADTQDFLFAREPLERESSKATSSTDHKLVALTSI